MPRRSGTAPARRGPTPCDHLAGATTGGILLCAKRADALRPEGVAPRDRSVSACPGVGYLASSYCARTMEAGEPDGLDPRHESFDQPSAARQVITARTVADRQRPRHAAAASRSSSSPRSPAASVPSPPGALRSATAGSVDGRARAGSLFVGVPDVGLSDDAQARTVGRRVGGRLPQHPGRQQHPQRLQVVGIVRVGGVDVQEKGEDTQCGEVDRGATDGPRLPRFPRVRGGFCRLCPVEARGPLSRVASTACRGQRRCDLLRRAELPPNGLGAECDRVVGAACDAATRTGAV